MSRAPRTLSKTAARFIHHFPRQRARQHQLAPLFFAAGDQTFARDYLASSLLCEIRSRFLSQLTQEFSRAGIGMAPIKGAAYDIIYADVAWRPMSDIDILVSPEQFDDAKAQLVRMGMLAVPTRELTILHHAETFKGHGIAVDLHRHITQFGRTNLPLTIPASGRLSAETLALIHVAHIARQDLIVPGIAYLDLLLLLDVVKPSRLAHTARAFSMERMFAAVVVQARAMASGRVTPYTSRIMELSPGHLWRRLPLKFKLTDPARRLRFAQVVAIEQMATKKISRGIAHKWAKILSKRIDPAL